MKTKAVRLYGKKDLRLEEFELPEIKENEILASVITDSICMSTWKLANQGADHKKAPNDLAENPIIIGHEFCGELLEVGGKWAHKYKKGERYAGEPAAAGSPRLSRVFVSLHRRRRYLHRNFRRCHESRLSDSI